ncbi:AAA family ATPase [Lacicoccus alkaliphilus]|uniref:Pilus assembly protein CpaE n=1 Tax=Lacicoccus alkaliphilus DSM 16010 TaxID=1123231 RepID=A0A1M7GNY1_9BACL|nr:P-loop NTPase [Salinicoccus alkaliphilus]SHM17891.1 pilus assembly protein CpaE [Salinicoccus alkaliphilus DSM 16010]
MTAEIILVASAVGGAGKTVVATNLALTMQAQGKRTILVDGDLQFGDMALALDLTPGISIKEAVERNDFKNIHTFCTMHASGVKLLPAPMRPEYADLVDAEDLSLAIRNLKSQAELIIVETHHGLTEQNMVLMDMADHIMVVTTPGIAALKNTRLMVETLDALGHGKKTNLIVNKYTIPTLMETKKLHDHLKMTQEKVFHLPYALKEISYSLDRGAPFVTSRPRHRFSKSIRKISNHLNGMKARKQVIEV